ncbi:mitochondrial carrier protein MTM1 isoform X2 [Eucalyptus grandis]|uniref:mitochondrial carrier protein MTM1 isoform X2 n=1 Tax=Eucalyptus grandis TaxID=71139 RepID=UPI00192ED826|nr:mitochondrial carrier protein MTM1 isoform X2 [Eucalyptus grandis]XP_039160032.1 mitochondrial carrier protein MTM1 isoform X2 [Eucalyptus grandis]XP_039160033.1 mitochondrial carrier protein MTM1 isoform X2 [Eucalyptus grandis]
MSGERSLLDSEDTGVAHSERTNDPWMNTDQSSSILIDSHNMLVLESPVHGREMKEFSGAQDRPTTGASDEKLGFAERAFSAAGAAFLSAIIVNPLDVAKMFADLRCSPSCTRAGVHGTVSICPPDCFRYKGTLDVWYKIIRQEGFSRLWRGTNAGLALAVPTVGIYLPCYDVFRNLLEDRTALLAPSLTPYVPLIAGSLARSLACASCYPIELARTRMQAFKATETGKKPPGVLRTLFEVVSHVRGTSNTPNTLQNYRALWTGMGAQLTRDVPFSAICWSTLEPIRRKLLGTIGDEASAFAVLGANFSAGFVAGSLAAAATCPFDVAKTRRQIEMDPMRALKMTTRQTLVEIWRDGGLKGLFTGAGPRVGRAGPSVGIVVSFYEVAKHVLHTQYATS